MQLHEYGALSFDCYGTLIDWEAGISTVLTQWVTGHGVSAGGEELLTRYSTHEAAAEADYPTDPYPEILARSLRGLGSELGIEVNQQDADTFARSVPDWPAFEDSAKALSRLGQRFTLIILSNVDRDVLRSVERALGRALHECHHRAGRRRVQAGSAQL